MKGYLVHKDGRRTEMPRDAVGCLRYYLTGRSADGRETVTVFEAEPEIVDGCIIYVEGKTGTSFGEVLS